jgi:hypothetical protein
MRLILTNQGSTSTPQLPSVRAGLARAEGDIASLKAAGCELGVNTGAGDPQAESELTTWPTITDRFRHFADAATGPAPSWTAGSETLECKWFSVNIETSACVGGIIHGRGTDEAIPLNYTLLNRSSGATSPRHVRHAMAEYAARTDGVTYDINSETLLSGGVNVTWQQFYDAMIATQRDAYTYLKGGESPRFGGRVVYDWKNGVSPLPFLSSGWWINPGREQSPSDYYYYPFRTVGGIKTASVSEGALVDASEQFSYPAPAMTPYSHATHEQNVIEKAIKTAEFSKPMIQRGVEAITTHFFYGMPLDDLATADSSVTGASGFYPIARGSRPPGAPGGSANEWQYLSGREAAMQEIAKAFRMTMLGSWKSFGPRAGLMFPATMDSVLSGNRHWGFGTPIADFKSMILDQITEPVSASEASMFGIAAGTVMSPTVVSLWDSTDYFLRGLFGASGPNANVAWNGQHPTTGEYFARMTMERRAAGRTAVAVDWSNTTWATNQWYIALANILSDDILERVQATRVALDRAIRKGAAKQTTLASLVGG